MEPKVKEKIIMGFAVSINTKINLLNIEVLLKKEKTRIMESISDDIKKVTNFITPFVSIEAKKQADIDLRNYNWHDQNKFDKGRKIFHFEHMIPISELRKRCIENNKIISIFNVLKNAKVVWILKEEDKRLTSLGFRSKRNNPEEAYRLAGIEIEQ